jgi:MFS family permease
MVVTGFGFMVQVASSNTLLQTIVDDSKRGRVMSFFLMAYFGTTPFGSLIAGVASARLGAPVTLAIGGLCCVGGALWFATRLSSLHAEIRPHYEQFSIPPIASEARGQS